MDELSTDVVDFKVKLHRSVTFFAQFDRFGIKNKGEGSGCVAYRSVSAYGRQQKQGFCTC